MDTIYKIKKVEDNQTREFEITFSEKLNVWVCYELITLDNGEIDSKLLDRGNDIVALAPNLI
tara:strand:+ start:405 stop:590 length:186 start_codon:yes stop_codon:yes gene_type:complete